MTDSPPLIDLPPAAARTDVLQIVAHGAAVAAAQALRAAVHALQPGLAVALRDRATVFEPGTRTVVLLEPPALSVARQMTQGVAPGMAIERWKLQAGEALEAVHDHPADVLLCDAASHAEAARIAAWDARLADLTGFAAAPDATALRPPEPALLHAADRLCRTHLAVNDMLQRLALVGMLFEAPALPAPPAADAAPAAAVSTTPPPAAGDDPVELLRRCLADAQQELEATYLRLRELQSESRGGVAAGRRALRVGHVRVQDIGADAMRLALRQFELVGLRLLPRVDLALVLVDGQPALRLYAAGTEPEVLGAWHSDGHEDGRAYMQFVPGRPEDRRRLQFLGAADWNVVAGTVVLLRRELATVGAAMPDHLRLACTRLARQVMELPPRFRYDALHVEPSADGLLLRFDGASFGGTDLGDTRVLWSGSRVTWQRNPKAEDLPLAGWPVDRGGQPADRWTLPVSAPLSGRERERAWAELTEHDRALVLAVLDAMPAAAQRVNDQTAAAHGGREQMAAAAGELLREGRRALARHQRRERLTRLPFVGRIVAA